MAYGKYENNIYHHNLFFFNMDVLIAIAAFLIVCVMNSTLHKFASILIVYVSAALIYSAVNRDKYTVCVFKDYEGSSTTMCHEFTI